MMKRILVALCLFVLTISAQNLDIKISDTPLEGVKLIEGKTARLSNEQIKQFQGDGTLLAD